MYKDDDENKMIYWSIVRDSPQEVFCVGKKTRIDGVLEDVLLDDVKAKDLIGYVKNKYGGGDYSVYGCNAFGEPVNSRPFSIPAFFPPKVEGNNMVTIEEGDYFKEAIRVLENENTKLKEEIACKEEIARNEREYELQRRVEILESKFNRIPASLLKPEGDNNV